jgi:hypothetical protein
LIFEPVAPIKGGRVDLGRDSSRMKYSKNVFPFCFLPIFTGIDRTWRCQEIPRRVPFTISRGYLITALFPTRGHRFTPLAQAAMLALEKNNIHMGPFTHELLTKNEITYLALAWFAAF